jgi:predicted nuclease with TOPRIM domain
MQADLDALEAKIAQMLERHMAMRGENLKLRQQIVSLENANKRLNDKLSEALGRMESLFNKLPD